jgi:8-oxo-dGTP diphosphatase
MDYFRYCPDCGLPLPAPSEPSERLRSQSCSACGAVHYLTAKPSAGALVVRGGKVLLGRRAIDPARGLWDIPGGFLDPWEHPADGAAREVAEETGLVVRPTEVFGIFVDTYAGRYCLLNICYLAEVVSGEEQPGEEVEELRWFGPDELPNDLATEKDRQALALWRRTVVAR